ncbi:MAG TPA: hypothetical protein VFG47_09340 [Geminicoccaceae bacterium]|nr:hypothetical protein [Geminicoccaceae bacterium]
MPHRVRRRGRAGLAALKLAAVAVAATAVGPTAATAQPPAADPDWPCIQRLVPELSAGMIWTGPPPDGAAATWRDDAAVRDLAAEIAARRTPLEEAERRVAEFADGLDPAARDERLTMLFAGVLDTINRERSEIISGIKRFARRQRALGGEIAEVNAALRELEREEGGGTAEERAARRREIEERRDWSVRIFDEREGSLTYLCEQPVLLDQRAFALAREIAAHLE